MGEQEKLARWEKVDDGIICEYVVLIDGVVRDACVLEVEARELCDAINTAHAASLAGFRERCIQAIKKNEGDWLITSDMGAGYAHGKADAIKSISEVPL